jgi:hypothetical protein
MLLVKHNNIIIIIIIIIIVTSYVLWNYLLRAYFIHVQFVGQPQNFTSHHVLDCRQLITSQRSLSALSSYQLLHARPQQFICYRSHGNKQQPDRGLKQNSPKCRSTALPQQQNMFGI